MTNWVPRSALIVEVPEAEPAVACYRGTLDANAALGIPAHVTVLSPFMPAAAIGPSVLAELEHLFGTVSRFACQFDRTDWFGDDVLWLAPRDPGPFRALTDRVYQAFPAFPPFEGVHEDVVPHLTVGHGHPLDALRSAEAVVRRQLPVHAVVRAVSLMAEQGGGEPWIRAAAFPLG